MADWKSLLEKVDQMAISINLIDFSSSDDLNKILNTLVSFNALPDIAGSSALTNIIKSAISTLNALKIPTDKPKIEETLSSLCSSLKAAMSALDRGDDPTDSIINRKTFFDVHPSEVPGFVSSANILLDEAAGDLLTLESSPQDMDSIDGVFRAFHTLKGEANLTGLASIGKLSSETENVLNELRAGTIKMDVEIGSLLLKVTDRLRALLNLVSVNPGKAAMEDVGDYLNQLQTILTVKKNNQGDVFKSNQPVLDLSSGSEILSGFIIEANEHLSNAEKSVLTLETSPDNQEAINNIFRSFHTIKGAARFLDLKDIQTLAHEAETMLDMVRRGNFRFEGHVVDLTLSSIDGLSTLLALLQEQLSNNGKIESDYPNIGPKIEALRAICRLKKNLPVGEILVKQGVVSPQDLQQALKLQQESLPNAKIGEILVASKAASAKQIEAALNNQKSSVFVGSSIRIQLDKLDSLMDLVGELVISQSQVMHSPDLLTIKHPNFQRNLSELDRITRNLQQLVMGMRLVQIGPVFHKMERLVRDLSKAIGKDVMMVMNGEETEIDKNMAELVADPLMHMVRNSVDHGIGFKEERVALGKSPVGRVELSASHKGGFVVIEVKDDGRGLDREKILKKAIERGIAKADENLSDSRIFNFIFEAGFSTAEKVTEVSGRGVGLDVVKKNVEKLHGKINISSQKGKGTTFSIYFPITLAIVDGIVIQVGLERYVLPINSVIEFIQPKEADRIWVYGKEEMYKFYKHVYPLIHLKDVFGTSGGKTKFEDQTICILESDQGKACVVIDELLGQQQVVIKNLGERLTNIPGISGAAILSDGRVGLIIDVSSLIEFAMKQGVT